MPAFIRALFGRHRADDDHTQIRSMSSDYIDNDLDEEQARRVKAHLDKCHLCAAFFNTLRATINLLGSAKPPGHHRPSENAFWTGCVTRGLARALGTGV